MQRQQTAARERWEELAARPDRTIQAIGWDDAVRKMESDNLKLQKARDNLRASEEGVRQVPRNYIPELTLNVFTFPTVGNLADGTLGNTFLFLGSIFNVPSPMRYRAEALYARLRYLSAQLDLEILRRDLRAKLYSSFRKSARQTADDREFSALARLGKIVPESPMAREAEEQDRQIRDNWQAIEMELSELLGDYTNRWRPLPDSNLPKLDYAAKPPALDGRGDFGATQITRVALQLVGIEAQRHGLLATEWPDVSVMLTAPPIYQRWSGNESYFDLNNVRVSVFLAHSTDFRGNRALARRQSDRRSEITHRELELAMQATMARLKDGIILLQELNSRSIKLKETETALQQAGALVEAAALNGQAAELEDQIDELNLSYWKLDDTCWQATL